MDLPGTRALLHLVLHALVPLGVALAWPRVRWWRAFLLLLAGWAIDVDHLLATPVYAAARCSIGFHPLHTWPAMLAYAALLVPRRTRLLGAGLWIHILLDTLDCALMR